MGCSKKIDDRPDQQEHLRDELDLLVFEYDQKSTGNLSTATKLGFQCVICVVPAIVA